MPHSEKNPSVGVNHAQVPVLPLRDVVVYPHMVIPLFVGREKSIAALEAAVHANKQILLIAQKSADIDDPSPDELHTIGTLSQILQLLKLPDGTVKVLVEGVERVQVEHIAHDEAYFTANVLAVREDAPLDERDLDVHRRTLLGQFENYVKLN